MTIAESKREDWLVGEMLSEQQRMRQVADQSKTNAQAEAQRIKAKLPLPPAASEGMFEVRFVQALVEIMTGRATVAKPDMVKMPETPYESIALVLSSTGQFYYRVTPQGCTCKGFVFRKTCRHFKAAFPELVAPRENGIGSENRLTGRQVKTPSQQSKTSRNPSRPWPIPRGSKITKNTWRTITPPTGCMNSSP